MSFAELNHGRGHAQRQVALFEAPWLDATADWDEPWSALFDAPPSLCAHGHVDELALCDLDLRQVFADNSQPLEDEALDALLDMETDTKHLGGASLAECSAPPPPPCAPSSPGLRDEAKRAQASQGCDDQQPLKMQRRSPDCAEECDSEASTAKPTTRRKVHTVAIPDEKIVKTFTAPIASCPYRWCTEGVCTLGMYYNVMSTVAPAKQKLRGHCLLWAHFCRACKAWHQVECHGRSHIYNAFRFDARGEFMDFQGLEDLVVSKAGEIPASWWGKPACGFGNFSG